MSRRHQLPGSHGENISVDGWFHLRAQRSVLHVCFQVNESNINLTEIAKLKRVEEAMARIAELRQCNPHLSEASIDEVCNEQSIPVTALIRGLSEKLAVQVCTCINLFFTTYS